MKPLPPFLAIAALLASLGFAGVSNDESPPPRPALPAPIVKSVTPLDLSRQLKKYLEDEGGYREDQNCFQRVTYWIPYYKNKNSFNRAASLETAYFKQVKIQLAMGRCEKVLMKVVVFSCDMDRQRYPYDDREYLFCEIDPRVSESIGFHDYDVRYSVKEPSYAGVIDRDGRIRGLCSAWGDQAGDCQLKINSKGIIYKYIPRPARSR